MVVVTDALHGSFEATVWEDAAAIFTISSAAEIPRLDFARSRDDLVGFKWLF